MPWWGWILVGAMLLGLELVVTTEFYLVLLGVAAVAVGLFGLVFDLAVWQQWLSFAVLAVVSLVGFRRRVWNWIEPGHEQVRDRMVGEVATVSERIEPGATGSAELRGSVWTARNVGDTAIDAGERARAVEIDGLTLEVRREP